MLHQRQQEFVLQCVTTIRACQLCHAGFHSNADQQDQLAQQTQTMHIELAATHRRLAHPQCH